MALVVPTLIYPNGGESILNSEITIRWNAISDNDIAFIELFYTDNYDPFTEPTWLQIASVLPSATNYLWRFGKALKSNKVRVAARTRNISGERSNFSISADNFSIQRKKLTTPSIIVPFENEKYDKSIEIIVDESGIIGTFSQKAYYQFYYSCPSLGIASTPIAQNIPVGSDPVLWNTSNLQPANDYILQVYLSDDGDNMSDSVFVHQIQISHEGFFIVDTTPPVGAIIINNDAAFTNKTEVNVQIISYDESTGVHSLLLTDGENTSKPDTIADVKRFIVSEENEIKTIQLKLQDFGANRSGDDENILRRFNVAINLEDSSIADIAIDFDNKALWAVTTGELKSLYKITDFPAKKATLELAPSSVIVYRTSVYIGMITGDNTGLFAMYDGASIVNIEIFTEPDSVINCMEVHGNYLFIGMENGFIYRFDGLNFDTIDRLDNPIKFMYSDKNLLYLTQKYDATVYAYNGSTFFATGA